MAYTPILNALNELEQKNGLVFKDEQNARLVFSSNILEGYFELSR
jgi:hypothetical protein